MLLRRLIGGIKMLNHFKSEANVAYTENGAVTNASTMSDCLDLFAVIGALRATTIRKSSDALSAHMRRNGNCADTRCCFLGLRVQGHLRYQGRARSHCKQGKGMATRAWHEP